MTDTTASLFREWDMLSEWIVPTLLDATKGGGWTRVWAVGEVGDAVAVTAAFTGALAGSGCGDQRDGDAFQAFATCRRQPFRLNRSDLRGLPAPVRSSAFRRSDSGWVASDHIARRIHLGEPPEPVDVVAVRADPPAPVALDQAIGRLRAGGMLIAVDWIPGAADMTDLRPVRGRPGLYEKEGPVVGAQPVAGGPSPAAGPHQTLADWQSEIDLVTSHSSLARSLARRFAGHGESRQDLDQVALLALVKAAGRFDPGRDITFSTFATATVLGELKRHFRDKTWMMRVPRAVQETYLAIKDAREALGHELSRSPTIPQIAARLGVSEETVLEAMEAGDNYWPESLDVGIHEGDAGRDVPVADPHFDLVLEQHDLQQFLPRLSDRERVLLQRLYFDGWTQRQAAREIGVSQMHISRLLGRTIEKLRRWAAEDRYCA